MTIRAATKWVRPAISDTGIDDSASSLLPTRSVFVQKRNVHHLLQQSKPAASKPGPNTHLLVLCVCRRTNSFPLGNRRKVSLHVCELHCLLLQAASCLCMSHSSFDREGDSSVSLLAPSREPQCEAVRSLRWGQRQTKTGHKEKQRPQTDLTKSSSGDSEGSPGAKWQTCHSAAATLWLNCTIFLSLKYDTLL